MSLNSSYKIGEIITLDYQVLDNTNSPITEGVLEINKVIVKQAPEQDITEIIGSYPVNNTNTGIITMEYQLTNLNDTKFYAVFKNSQNYDNSDTSNDNDNITINIYDKINSSFSNMSNLLSTYKLGETVVLTYHISNVVNEGNVEFHKVNNISLNDEIISNQKVDADGNASISYKLSDIGSIGFYGIFNNSVNYHTKTTYTDIINVTINKQYATENTLTINGANIVYGDTITLSSDVSSTLDINEGYIEFYVIVNDNNNSELIDIIPVISNHAEITYVVNDMETVK